MVAEGNDDGEGQILEAVRLQVGEDVPIVAQLDIHSNVSDRMVDMADILIGRETYPAVDMAERGRECADVLVRMVKEGLKPAMALCRIPLVWGMNQVTKHSSMSEAIGRLHELEKGEGIVCGSIATCYPLADVPDMGVSVYVVTEGDRALAKECADELGELIFERWKDWQLHRPSTKEAIEAADRLGKYPVNFADRDDNTGGGSPGDSTVMLTAFVDAGLNDACILYMVDPEAIDACTIAGVGSSLRLDIGGKSSQLQGVPVSLEVEVLTLSDGRFSYEGPMYAGLEGNMGPSAHVAANGLHILLVSGREQPFDTAFARSLGLDPTAMRYIGVKSAAHFRSGCESWAGAFFVVAEPSVHNPAGGSLAFKNLGRRVYPFDEI